MYFTFFIYIYIFAVNWKESTWIFSKNIKENNDDFGPCEAENDDTDIYFPKTSFEECMLNCQALGGILPIPESQSKAKMQVGSVKNNMENPSEWNVMYYLDKIEPGLSGLLASPMESS